MKVDNEVFTLSIKNMPQNTDLPYNIKVFNREFSLLDRLFYFGKQHKIYNKICNEYPLNKFNIVHAHTLFSAGYSAYLLHKKFGLPYIVTIRNTDINVFFKYMFHLRFLGLKIMKDSKKIIFLSPSYRDFFADKYLRKKDRLSFLEKTVVIPNGIDNYFLNNKSIAKAPISTKSVRLIYIGEVCGNKNIETTIKACKLLIEKGYSVDYTIVGEVNEVKYNKIIAKNAFINYHPSCIKEELVFYLRNSDIFVMPSLTETFGIVYAEAMSQGLPIIYSKGQGFDGQFENGVVGYAVNCYDHRYIACKIIDLLNNYQEFSKRCVSLVDKFNWQTIANEYKNIYSICQRLDK